jgi:hypothetical protein
MSHIETAKKIWNQGAVEISAVDKNGDALKQYDYVIAHDGNTEWRIGCITYSLIDKGFVAHFEETWISFEDLNVVEKLNNVIAQEVLGWEKIETQWGKDGKAFNDMSIEEFDAINYAGIILDKLNSEDQQVQIKNEDGYCFVTANDDDVGYVDEKFGIAVCKAAINLTRNN